MKKWIMWMFLFTATHTFACTLAFWNNDKAAPIVGRTMDLYMDDLPKLVIYPRGIARDGMAGSNSEHWIAKYGSVVITSLNKPIASEGLNEYGLSASLLYLDKTSHEFRNNNIPGLANMMWAQYVLDNYKTVQEVIDNINTLQIVSISFAGREWPLHLTIQDSTGDSAVFEFIHGTMKIHHGKQYNVVANEPAYDIQLDNLKNYKLFGGKLPMPGDVDSLSRFIRAASYLKTLPQPKDDNEAAAFLMGVIRTVMVPYGAEDTSGNETTDSWPTRWASLRDLKNKIYYFYATKTPNVIWVDLNQIKFDSNEKVLELHPDNPSFVGNVLGQMK
jgi:penicillin V acylase-like amidase (Ntn superfamily)